MSKQEYGNHSIKSLTDREAVRMRVSTYAGGNDKYGAFTTIREVVSNSIDEYKAGHGNNITVEYLEDGSIKVADEARGCPLDFNEAEQKYNYELIFLTLNSGGKYSQDNYEFSLGLNGIGNALMALSSEFCFVEVKRDGYKYNLEIKKGEIIGELKKEKIKGEYKTGTTIHWKPDLEVFTENDFPVDWFTDYLNQQAIVNKGLSLIFIHQGVSTTFYYENGIIDYINLSNKGKQFTEVVYVETETKGRDREDKPEYKSKYQIAFCFNNEINLMESYHNSSFLKHGGSPHDAIKSAFVSAIDKLLKDKGKYLKGEKKVSFDDIKESLVIVTNTYSTETSYENQTKFAITNKFIREFMTNYLKEQLEIYFIENPIETEKIIGQILVNKRSREKAEKARVDIKKKLSGEITVTNKVDGFVPCKSKDNTKTELYIVEGLSALGSVVMARDSEYQAVFAIRGKILNCLKADYDKVFKNDVIVNLIKVLGCGVEVRNKNKDLNTFDIDNLRWDKIIICTDADVDGFQIRTLVLTALYRIVPTLINEGRVYIAETPLFEIIDEQGKSHFAYDENEKNAIVSKLKGKVTIQRSKGLGENDADMMNETTMNAKSRSLIKVLPEDVEKMNESFELFLGDDIQTRKEYIAQNGYKYVDLTDLE